MLCEEAENRDGLAKGSTIRPQVIVENLVVSAMKGLDLSVNPLRGAFVDGHLLISYYFLFSYLLSCIGASGCELGPVW